MNAEVRRLEEEEHRLREKELDRETATVRAAALSREPQLPEVVTQKECLLAVGIGSFVWWPVWIGRYRDTVHAVSTSRTRRWDVYDFPKVPNDYTFQRLPWDYPTSKEEWKAWHCQNNIKYDAVHEIEPEEMGDDYEAVQSTIANYEGHNKEEAWSKYSVKLLPEERRLLVKKIIEKEDIDKYHHPTHTHKPSVKQELKSATIDRRVENIALSLDNRDKITELKGNLYFTKMSGLLELYNNDPMDYTPITRFQLRGSYEKRIWNRRDAKIDRLIEKMRLFAVSYG
jgi:hypothetical protein